MNQSDDPTSESFKPVASVKSEETTICFKSRTIGAIEGMFLGTRILNQQSVKFYIELCNELNYEGDKDVLNYIKDHPFIKYDYKYENGIHSVSL